MQMLKKSLLIAVGSLVLTASASAQEIVETREYSRNGEISPGASAPTINQMVQVIENGSPIRLKAVLEYGERVVCAACVPLLERNLLTSNNASVREMSAWWLRRQPFAAPHIVMSLRSIVRKDGSAERRARAAEALGEFMDAHAVPELSEAVLDDKDVSVRVAAVHAIARLNSESGFAVLTDALEDRDRRVRLATLDELVNIGGFRDHGAVIALLGDSDADVRTRAARLAGEYRIASAEGALIAMLEGDDAVRARKAAAWALGRIGGADGQVALQEASGTEQEQRVLDAIEIAQRMPGRF
jgi:HEAT repeat protein